MAVEAVASVGDSPDEMVAAVEHEIRIFIHDLVTAHHEKDFRALAVFPMASLAAAKLVVFRADYRGGLVVESVVGPQWEPGGWTISALIWKGHMTLLEPPKDFDLETFLEKEETNSTPVLGFTFYWHLRHDQPKTSPGKVHCRLCKQSRKAGEAVGVRRHSCLASVAAMCEKDDREQVMRGVRRAGESYDEGALVLQELFAGTGRITREWSKSAPGLEPIEVFKFPQKKSGYRAEHDLTLPDNQHRVLKCATEGPANVWWIAAPCTSYCDWQIQNGGSRTFTQPEGTGEGPLASTEATGNNLSNFAADTFETALDHGAFPIAESSASSGRGCCFAIFFGGGLVLPHDLDLHAGGDREDEEEPPKKRAKSEHQERRDRVPEADGTMGERRDRDPEDEAAGGERRDRDPEDERRDRDPEAEAAEGERRDRDPEVEDAEGERRDRDPEAEDADGERRDRVPEVEDEEGERRDRDPEAEDAENRNPGLEDGESERGDGSFDEEEEDAPLRGVWEEPQPRSGSADPRGAGGRQEGQEEGHEVAAREDRWVNDRDRCWLYRVHHEPRRRLYVPAQIGLPFDLGQLRNERRTILHTARGVRVVIDDDWRSEGEVDVGYGEWTGHTVFTLQGNATPQEHVFRGSDEDEDSDATHTGGGEPSNDTPTMEDEFGTEDGPHQADGSGGVQGGPNQAEVNGEHDHGDGGTRAGGEVRGQGDSQTLGGQLRSELNSGTGPRDKTTHQLAEIYTEVVEKDFCNTAEGWAAIVRAGNQLVRSAGGVKEAAEALWQVREERDLMNLKGIEDHEF
eukprot:s1381_g27.t1